MKKAVLLTSIIASMATMANVTGSIEAKADTEVKFTKSENGTVVSGDVNELSLKGEVKVNKLTLGAVLKNKDIKEISKVKPLTTEMYTENLLDNSSVYAKYELPEFSGIKSYVKGTLNPKAKYEADGTLNFKKGNVELEGQLAHSFSNGAEVSLTSKTTFPFEKKDGEYGKAASSEHTLKLGAKKLNNFEDLEASLTIGHVYAKDGFRKAELNTKGTYVGLKDTKLNGEFNFIDEKEDDGKTDKNMAVSLKAGANYKGVKDLELDGKFNFKYQVKGTSKVKDIITDSDIVLNKDAYAHSYELDAKYTGVKDLELTAGAFVQHIHFDEGGIGNYVANPLEYLSVKSLMSNDPEFFAKYRKELEEAKKELEAVKQALNNVTAEKKAESDKAKDIWNKVVKAKKADLENDVNKAKAEFEKLTAAQKTVSQEVYENQTKLNDVEEQLKEVEKELAELDKVIDNKNETYITTKKVELTAKKGKLNTQKTELEGKLSGKNADKGKLLANAEKEVKYFKEDSLKESDTILFSVDDKGNVKINDGDQSAKTLFSKFNDSEYAKAMKKVNDAMDKFQKTSKEYKEKVEATKMFTAKLDLVNFGFKLGAKYTGVKNLTLTADGVFAGRHHSGFDQLLKYPSYTTGYVKLHTGAKYDFKLLNDKLVVSPEGNVTATFADIYAGMVNPSLVLAPKVSVEYKPVDTLKVSGSVEVPVNFGRIGINEFGYQSTSIKGAFNMKYEWK